MNKYNCTYDGGEYNYINTNVFAEDVEDARQIVIRKWGLNEHSYIKIKSI